jgi:hypothetical protein
MRIVSVVAAVVLIAGPAIADPRKPDPQDQQQQRSAPVILAAAETPHTLSVDSAQQNPVAPKRRVGRITTCRCGDPQPGNQNRER